MLNRLQSYAQQFASYTPIIYAPQLMSVSNPRLDTPVMSSMRPNSHLPNYGKRQKTNFEKKVYRKSNIEVCEEEEG